MGYTTEFKGAFTVTPPLTAEQIVLLQRMNHADDAAALRTLAPGSPDAWCQWRPTLDGTRIEWDRNEKFYKYVEWINWIAAHVVSPSVLSGVVEYQGESDDDRGTLEVRDGTVAQVPWAPKDAAERVWLALSEARVFDGDDARDRERRIVLIRKAIAAEAPKPQTVGEFCGGGGVFDAMKDSVLG